ncbi:MAG: SRPBCC family protein [Chloroflexi bacterium]|nr:SRPBCC family protein [Chloroflexota bacterium]
MTRIDAEVIVPAHPLDVWPLLSEHERWPAWNAPVGGKLRLASAELLAGPPDRVGAVREGTVILARVPLLGTRTVGWAGCTTDIACPWTVEFEAAGRRGAWRWRLRIWLLEHGDDQCRVRCRLEYAAPALWLRVVDALIVRREVAGCLDGVLRGLAGSLAVEVPAAIDELAHDALFEPGTTDSPEPIAEDASVGAPEATVAA